MIIVLMTSTATPTPTPTPTHHHQINNKDAAEHSFITRQEMAKDMKILESDLKMCIHEQTKNMRSSSSSSESSHSMNLTDLA